MENVETDYISVNIEDITKVETDTGEEEDKEEETVAMENNSIVIETRIPSDHLEKANYKDSFEEEQNILYSEISKNEEVVKDVK